jgi:hypothetical protein
MWSLPECSIAGCGKVHPPKTPCARSLLLSLLFCVASSFCFGQTHDVVCDAGYGKFEVRFSTGVTVHVGAARNDSLSKRVCAATLAWDKQDLVVVPEASQVDIDVLGADLGLDTPVVAFQIKRFDSDSDSRNTYQIYSLKKPPRLLRTITGGDVFGAADTDMDSRIEIWTGDARAVDGFENLTLGELDFAPTIVLRFEKHRLVDVSSEFRSYFDRQISEVRSRLDPQELGDFKNSDGKLPTTSSLPVEQAHRLRVTKVKVLEIVWSYLYSRREQEAWQALAEMWPAADLDRIRASLLTAQTRGVRSEMDGVSAEPPRVHSKKFAYIYETPANTEAKLADSRAGSLTADINPQAILIRRPPPQGGQIALPDSETSLDLVIDAAGKVRSAKAVGDADKDLIAAAAQWKFIPAFRDGHPVACRLRFVVRFLR